MGTRYTAVLDRIVEAERGRERDLEGATEDRGDGSGDGTDVDGTEAGTEAGGNTDDEIADEPRPEREELAVLLLEDDGDVVDERTIPVDRLPADGAHEGAVLEVEIADEGEGEGAGDGEAGTLLAVTHDPETERNRRERAQDRFDRLSERLSEE